MAKEINLARDEGVVVRLTDEQAEALAFIIGQSSVESRVEDGMSRNVSENMFKLYRQLIISKKQDAKA